MIMGAICARTYNNAHWNESSKFYRARKFRELPHHQKQAMGKTTRKNACSQETMMKKRSVIVFTIAQVALAKDHTSRRSIDIVNAVDRAIRCNQNTETQRLSNRVQKNPSQTIPTILFEFCPIKFREVPNTFQVDWTGIS